MAHFKINRFVQNKLWQYINDTTSCLSDSDNGICKTGDIMLQNKAERPVSLICILFVTEMIYVLYQGRMYIQIGTTFGKYFRIPIFLINDSV